MFILTSTFTGCVSISAFTWLVWVPAGVTSFAIGLKICVIATGIKKYKSIIKKKKKKYDKIALLGEDQLNAIKVLILLVIWRICFSK